MALTAMVFSGRFALPWGSDYELRRTGEWQRRRTARTERGSRFCYQNHDRFFIFGENGDLFIARLSPEKYEELSRTKLLNPVGVGLGRAVVWSHPAYANQCVVARNDQEILCVSLANGSN